MVRSSFTIKLLVCFILFIPFVLYSQGVATRLPQTNERNPEWVKEDLEGVKFLVKLMPIENQSIKRLNRQFKTRCPQCHFPDYREKLGFGAERATYSLGLNSISVYLDIFYFKNTVAYYEMGVASIDSEHDRKAVVDTWKNNGGPKFREEAQGISYQRKIDPVLDSYFREVAQSLGPMKSVQVPADLADAYDHLTSHLENSRVGEPPDWCTRHCTNLKGRGSIAKLVEARRIDLIENVLRGYNPGGRVYAAIALLRLKQKGRSLAPDIQFTLKKVVKLDVPITICHPCGIRPELRAREAVSRFVSLSLP